MCSEQGQAASSRSPRPTHELALTFAPLDDPPDSAPCSYSSTGGGNAKGSAGPHVALLARRPRPRDGDAACRWSSLGGSMGTSVEQIDGTYGHPLPDSIDRTKTALNTRP